MTLVLALCAILCRLLPLAAARRAPLQAQFVSSTNEFRVVDAFFISQMEVNLTSNSTGTPSSEEGSDGVYEGTAKEGADGVYEGTATEGADGVYEGTTTEGAGEVAINSAGMLPPAVGLLCSFCSSLSM
jgi:hypothetical protein